MHFIKIILYFERDCKKTREGEFIWKFISQTHNYQETSQIDVNRLTLQLLNLVYVEGRMFFFYFILTFNSADAFPSR